MPVEGLSVPLENILERLVTMPLVECVGRRHEVSRCLECRCQAGR